MITVIGSADSGVPRRVLRQARTLGRQAARRGYVTVSGACPGAPQAAIEGAKERGGATGGFSSYATPEAHRASGVPTKGLDFIQLTNLPPGLREVAKGEPNFMGREVTMIDRSDAAIVFRGRTGTLSEISMALSAGKPIGVVVGTGGIADAMQDVVAAIRATGKAPSAPIFFDTAPTRLLKKMERAIEMARLSRRLGRPRPEAQGSIGTLRFFVETPEGRQRISVPLAPAPRGKIPSRTLVVGAEREASDPFARLRAKGKAVVNVVGTSNNAPHELLRAARIIGGELAGHGHVTVSATGAGVSQSAIEGAKRRRGTTAGISPFRTKKLHETHGESPGQPFDLLQLTSQLEGVKHRAKHEPNYLGAALTAAERADALVVMGGSIGSLFALSAAIEGAKPVGVLEGHGGIAAQVKKIVDQATKAGKPPAFPIIYDSDPRRLIERMQPLIEASRDGGHRGPLGDGNFVNRQQ